MILILFSLLILHATPTSDRKEDKI